MYHQNSTIETSFKVTGCGTQDPLKNTQPGGYGRPALPFQLFIKGYDATNQLILGFATAKEFDERKSAILSHIHLDSNIVVQD